MRKRKTIESQFKGQGKSFYSTQRDLVKIELLLDIRQLLIGLSADLIPMDKEHEGEVMVIK